MRVPKDSDAQNALATRKIPSHVTRPRRSAFNGEACWTCNRNNSAISVTFGELLFPKKSPRGSDWMDMVTIRQTRYGYGNARVVTVVTEISEWLRKCPSSYDWPLDRAQK